MKQIGQSLEILGAIIFIVGLFLFATWRIKDGTGDAGLRHTVKKVK